MPDQTKRIPQRRCCACGQKADKASLLRIVRLPDGSVTADVKGKASGRGVYICRKAACLDKARKKKAAERSLKTALSQEVYRELEESIEAG